MVNRKKISVNVLFSLLQIFFTAVSYYFLYQFLLKSLGGELMGVWSIVLSISATANIANLGIGSSVVRYTATYTTDKRHRDINSLIQTSILFLGAVFLFIVLVLYLIAPFWLQHVVEPRFYQEAIMLFPFSLVCLLTNALAGIFLSCLDGLQKNYLRSVLYIVSFVILLLGSYFLVPRFGLLGVGYAQLAQAIFLLLSSFFSLNFVLKNFSLFPLKWNKEIFKSIFSFGLQEQIIAIFQLCFDPFTKSMLSIFGGLHLVAYYEMANRMVVQLRAFVISINQVFLPVFSSVVSENSPGKIEKMYRDVFKINYVISIFWLVVLLTMATPVSRLWIGEINNDFIITTVLLSVAYFFNIIMTVAYFANMAMARLKINVVGNIIISVLNFSLCFILGYFFSRGYGVIVGWAVALSAGSLYILFKFHAVYKIGLRTTVFDKPDIIMLIGTFVYGVAIGFIYYYFGTSSMVLLCGISFTLFVAFCLFMYLLHPMPKLFFKQLKQIKSS